MLQEHIPKMARSDVIDFQRLFSMIMQVQLLLDT